MVATDPDTGAQVEYAHPALLQQPPRLGGPRADPHQPTVCIHLHRGQDFYNEPGVNFKRTIGAMINEYLLPIYSSKQGASTLEQQLIRT